MTSTSRVAIASLFLLLLGACASTGRGAKAPATVHQADERIPPLAELPAGDQRIAYNDALTKEQAGWRAEQAGKADEAKEPLGEAARGFLSFLERFPNTGWDLTFRFHAADLLRRAGRADEAVALAEQVANDPRASPKTRAMGWLQAANALTTAGKLEPIEVEAGAERREAREVPPEWKRYVEATDAYLAALGPAGQEPPDRILGPGVLALVAARLAYATGDVEGARERLAAIVDRWANEPQAFQGAAPLYVQTHLATGDQEGASRAIERVKEVAEAEAGKAKDQDARGVYEKVAADTERLAASARYATARALLEEGKMEEAARAFEELAEEGTGDVAAALVGAAVAWDRAGDAKRAEELRRKVIDEHGDSRVAPGAALSLAASLSKKGDHEGAARVYGLHAERWPDDPNHCAALRNGAVELDVAKRGASAAERYSAFGRDARCVEASPDVAALALHRAGQLYLAAKKRAEARDAFQAAAAVEGVTSADAKKHVADAQRQAKKLGGTAAGRRQPRR